jgi:hypothetical protein
MGVSRLARLPIIENISIYHEQYLVRKLQLRATTISAEGPTRDAVLADYELLGVKSLHYVASRALKS